MKLMQKEIKSLITSRKGKICGLQVLVEGSEFKNNQ